MTMRYENYTNEKLAEDLAKMAKDLAKNKQHHKAKVARYAAMRLNALSDVLEDTVERYDGAPGE